MQKLLKLDYIPTVRDLAESGALGEYALQDWLDENVSADLKADETGIDVLLFLSPLCDDPLPILQAIAAHIEAGHPAVVWPRVEKPDVPEF